MYEVKVVGENGGLMEKSPVWLKQLVKGPRKGQMIWQANLGVGVASDKGETPGD